MEICLIDEIIYVCSRCTTQCSDNLIDSLSQTVRTKLVCESFQSCSNLWHQFFHSNNYN